MGRIVAGATILPATSGFLRMVRAEALVVCESPAVAFVHTSTLYWRGMGKSRPHPSGQKRVRWSEDIVLMVRPGVLGVPPTSPEGSVSGIPIRSEDWEWPEAY